MPQSGYKTTAFLKRGIIQLLESFFYFPSLFIRSDIQINVGDIVNILGEFNADNVCYITDENNLFVIHPDWLISGTSVVNSIHCMRK